MGVNGVGGGAITYKVDDFDKLNTNANIGSQYLDRQELEKAGIHLSDAEFQKYCGSDGLMSKEEFTQFLADQKAQTQGVVGRLHGFANSQ